MKKVLVQASAIYSTQGQRSQQEDHALVLGDRGIFVVADGFGGVSSDVNPGKATCEAVMHFLNRQAEDQEATMPFEIHPNLSTGGNLLFNAFSFANQRMLKKNKNRNIHSCVGSSVVSAVLDRDLLAVASIGSCQATLLRSGTSEPILHPHSYQRFCDPMGWVFQTEEIIPLSALGVGEYVRPQLIEMRIKEGDWLLLQTDGVRPEIVEEIRSLNQQNLGPEASVSWIDRLFKSFSFTDNATISLALF